MKPGLVFSFVLIALAGCLVTDRLHIAPTDSVPGEHVRIQIEDRALSGYYWGIYSYCSHFSNRKACLADTNGAMLEGFFLIGMLSPDYNPARPNVYYRKPSVEDCLRDILNHANLLTYTQLHKKGSCTGSVCSPDTAAVSAVAPLIAHIAIPSCQLQETGKMISLGSINL